MRHGEGVKLATGRQIRHLARREGRSKKPIKLHTPGRKLQQATSSRVVFTAHTGDTILSMARLTDL
jgi:hypothetical protein